jgi:uncharacterized protein YbjQ (UPF0145 family)
MGLEIVFFVALILIGLVCGSFIERKHFLNLDRRERRYRDITLLTAKSTEGLDSYQNSALAVGSTVVAVDFFKTFIAAIMKLIGGELKSYSSLIERARRESVLRMIEAQPQAKCFVNVRIETSSVSSTTKNSVSSVEAFAYGTALWNKT